MVLSCHPPHTYEGLYEFSWAPSLSPELALIPGGARASTSSDDGANAAVAFFSAAGRFDDRRDDSRRHHHDLRRAREKRGPSSFVDAYLRTPSGLFLSLTHMSCLLDRHPPPSAAHTHTPIHGTTWAAAVFFSFRFLTAQVRHNIKHHVRTPGASFHMPNAVRPPLGGGDEP